VNPDSLGSSGVSTTLLSNLIAPGPHQSNNGQVSTKLLLMSRTIQPMTRLSIHSHSQSSLVNRVPDEAVAHQRLSGLRSLSRRVLARGSSLQLTFYRKTLIGDRWMAATTCPGPRTNTFLSTVDLAGPKVPQAPSLTDSILWTTWRTLLQLA